MNYKDLIRVIPDFPEPGISFKDITTLLKNGPAFSSAIQEMAEYARKQGAELIVGPEARGFVLAAPMASMLSVGFVPVRKPGKLPYETESVSYALEYGKDTLQIHKDAIQPGQKVVVADDLLATGGTTQSTIQLVEKLGGVVVGIAFMIELSHLGGRQQLQNYDIFSLVTYD